MKDAAPRWPLEPRPFSSRRACPANPCAACAVRILSFCDAIEREQIDRLAAITTTRTVEPHGAIVNEGDPAEHLFNVTAGTVKVYKLLADGRQQITGFLFPGDFLGLSSNERYAYSAEAVTSVTYCRFARKKLDQLLIDFPRVEHRLLGIASHELAAAQDQMLLLGRKSAREKVASFILMLARRGEKMGLAASPVHVPMTRADIADYLGLTIETVSRVMTQLRKWNAIALPTPDEIHITDHRLLEAVAEDESCAR
jgi:CRP/FNR family transcriptional regulator, anaerobic regulatory protein